VGDDGQVLAEVRAALDGGGEPTARFRRVVEAIRTAGGYRWVGLYGVVREEISILAWSGPGEPAHPRFSLMEGLSGEAIRRRETVVVADVTRDPRYLTTFGTTRSEIIVPILNTVTGRPRGVLDVESERVNAFTDADRTLLERCAAELARDLSPAPG
jgi:putative methionine-R-sulfoxide reductase with GAF domain